MPRYSVSKFMSFGLLCIVVGLLFKNTLATLFGQAISWLPILGLFVCSACYLISLLKIKINTNQIVILFYFFYLFTLVLIYPVLSEYGSYPTAMIGLSNLGTMLCFWLFFFRKGYDEQLVSTCIKLFVAIGFLNAIFAVVQIYHSESLFGLISNDVYTNEDVLLNENVTRRAISFIASPQSLSLYLAFCFALTFWEFERFGYILLVRVVIFFVGVLTVSKAFFVFLTVFFLIYYFNAKNIIRGVVVFSLFSLAIAFFQESLGRVIQVFEFMSNLESYSAYIVWRDSIMYAFSFPEALLGRGIGVFSRGSQMLFDYVLIFGSAESFFIQLFVETGVLGLLIFSIILTLSLLGLYKRNRVIFSCLCGFITIGLFTPAIYGYATGVCFYFCLVLGIISRFEPLSFDNQRNI